MTLKYKYLVFILLAALQGCGGGGGAGGYLTNVGGSAITLNEGSTYTITIGAGGTASATGGAFNNDGNTGSNGTSSVFGPIRACAKLDPGIKEKGPRSLGTACAIAGNLAPVAGSVNKAISLGLN